MKRIAINLLKYGVSLAIIGWLVRGIQSQDPEAFSRMVDQPKDWTMFTLGWLLCMSGVAVAIFRWYLLVRALDLRFSITDAFRLGAIGYLFNFVSVGSVGGDLFKAVFIAREQPGRRALMSLAPAQRPAPACQARSCSATSRVSLPSSPTQ